MRMKQLKLLTLTMGMLFMFSPKLEAKVVLINVFEVPEGKVNEAIKMWETARTFLKAQPGYISTELHQSLDNSARFQLINVAEWEDAESFKNATEAMKKSGNLPKIDGLVGNPSLYKIIKTDN